MLARHALFLCMKAACAVGELKGAAEKMGEIGIYRKGRFFDSPEKKGDS